MTTKKSRTPKRLPAIVPRFIKNAVAIGTIPALSSGCFPSSPPVVAHYQRPHHKKQRPEQGTPADAAEATPPVQPVVAAMMPSPVVAAVVPQPLAPPPVDAGVDAPAPKPAKKPAKPTKPTKPLPPDLYGVAAMFAPDPRGELVPLVEKPKKP